MCVKILPLANQRQFTKDCTPDRFEQFDLRHDSANVYLQSSMEPIDIY